MKTRKNQKRFLAPRKFLKFSVEAQLYGQIFIYILTLLIISFILIYGYKSISSFKGRTSQIVSLKLGEDLKNSVQRITPDFGSIIKKEIDIGEASQICFVETYENINNLNLPIDSNGNPINDPIIKDSIRSNSDKNTFLMGKSVLGSFYTGNISVQNDVLCLKSIGGKVSLKLEGKGDHALISSWA